ncbi:MAG: proline--tRNA ligase [Chloroflexota bacterium]
MAEANRTDSDFVKEITPKSQDYSQWYVDVIRKAELMDYAPVKGCMVIRPYGYALWERVQEGLDRRFKATGHMNAYFPMFIPESFLLKEAEHVEGFAPECAWVTIGGGEELTEKLAIRPTSETIICSMYAKWIKSYRDLPVLINQWANVVRWEKSVRPFLRTTEFLWQEGHTAHRSAADAEAETARMLDVYRDFVETDLAIPVIPGRKTEKEKFAGAVATYSIEALMGDGKALQAGTSHYLGDRFAKGFGIQFLDEDNTLKYVQQTSWGMSTRIVGAIIMVHGDDRGLVLPPKVAPFQVVIVPIAPTKERESVLAAAVALRDRLAGVARVKLDDRAEYTPGWKFNDWEMRGVPLRVEIGPRDIKNGQCVLVRRDSGEKATVPLAGVETTVSEMLVTIQAAMFDRAKQFMSDNTSQVETLAELGETIEQKRGLVLAGWCGDPECEAKVKDETGATIRNIPFSTPATAERCVCCGQPARHTVYFARAY